MATPLNVFKTVTNELTVSNEIIYTVPTGNTGIILMAQVANITGTAADVTFSHYDPDTTTETELIKGFEVPGNDAVSVITGKLVLEEGKSVKAYASTGSALKLTMSVLESLNA